jgi:uncharacterized protein (DUF2336 family)
MAEVALDNLLVDKAVGARMEIARRVGMLLCVEGLAETERRAAEALARNLVEDAIERVRGELSICLKSAPQLPRDVAMKIAHDVDTVSSPFLEVTDIFSEDDWQQLVLTISRGARVAVARRTSMSEGLAVMLAEIGDTLVAQTLVENPAAPMTPPVCGTLIERFEASTWILDKLAERGDLHSEVAAHLVTKVSAAARAKMVETYRLDGDGAEIIDDARVAALLRIAAGTPVAQLSSFCERLHQDNALSFPLLLGALHQGLLHFFEFSVAELAGLPAETIASVVRRGSDGHLTALLSRVQVPGAVYADIWDELQAVRRQNPRVVH